MKCVLQVLHYSYIAYDRYAVDGLLNVPAISPMSGATRAQIEKGLEARTAGTGDARLLLKPTLPMAELAPSDSYWNVALIDNNTVCLSNCGLPDQTNKYYG